MTMTSSWPRTDAAFAEIAAMNTMQATVEKTMMYLFIMLLLLFFSIYHVYEGEGV